MRRLVASLAIGTVISAGSALAQETPTIAKILERGEIVIGHRPASPPFGYIAEDGKVTGYSVEICKYVADYLKKALGKPGLKTTFVPVDAANRIPLVQNGTIDLECAGTGNTAERQKVVSFLYNTMYTDTRLMVRKGSGINVVADLKGKRVAVPQGTVQQKMISDLDKKENLGIVAVMSKDASDTFRLLDTGRADAAIHVPMELLPFSSKSSTPDGFTFISDWAAPPEQVSIMIAKGDEKFRAAANAGMKEMMDNGKFEENYKSWFSVPPYNMPMPEALRNQIANPNDKPIGG